MKFTLMIEGSKDAIVAVLNSLPADTAVREVTQRPDEPTLPFATDDDDNDDGDGDDESPFDRYDSAGMPWDERIHSANKAVNKDGTWRQRRGVDAQTVEAVTAELRGAGAPQMPATVQQAPQMPAPVQQAPQMPASVPNSITTQTVPPMPPMQAPQTVPPMPPSGEPAPADLPTDLTGFMMHISPLMSSGAVDGDYLKTVVERINQGFGSDLKTITDINGDPQKIAYAVQLMQLDGRW